MSFKNWITKVFFNEAYDIQHRLLNVIVLSGVLGATIALIFQIVLSFNDVGALLICACLSIFLFTLWVANGLKRPQLAGVIISLSTNNVTLPLLFLYSGGTQSAMPLWCLVGFILSFLLLKGKKTYFIFAINVLGFVGILIYSLIYPESVHYMDSQKEVVIDIATNIVIIALIISSVLKYNNYIYENQRKKIYDAMEVAQKATEAKSDFLSKMSHDIRTPMNTIIGFTELAKKNVTNREKVTDSLAKISLASNHLLSLMNDILDMTKIEKGAVSIEEETCSLKSLIQNCCQIMQNDIEEKKLTVKTDYSMLDDDAVSCDKLRMNQVLLNILSNAIKYSKPNGNVLISIIQLTSEDESKIDTEIHIKDDGCGMSEEYKTKLFTPFSRDSAEIEGSGLGLAITKSLVEIMGGTIEIDSEEDKGTEVVVSIPFSIPSLSELEEEISTKKYNFEGYKVLLVDDNDLHREIEVEILKEVGFDVDEASEGRFAIQKHMKLHYDLILMDLVMPVMDGYQATKIIRSMDDVELSKTPIIAITANAYADDKAKAFDAGMNAYVTKPFNKTQLYEVLKLILKEKISS